jgi:hypothetical protein
LNRCICRSRRRVGRVGGTLTINDFIPGRDTINLVGYQSIVGGSTQITLSGNSHIVLPNFGSTIWHPTIS